MKTKLIPALFIIAAVSIAAAFFFTKKFNSQEDNSPTRAKIVTPKSTKQEGTSEELLSSENATETFETFVPLLPNETLISTLTIDFNNDTFDDEVIVVRKSGFPYLLVIPGLYNSETNSYDRLEEIETKISRTRTFSYTSMDITGEHKNALICQGIEDDGNYVMKIYQCQTKKGKPELLTIGDFSSDGTIFIQQTERSEYYEMSLSKGESFSVWVYKSDKENEPADSNTTNLNQIQQEYKYNSATQKYELAKEIKVAAKRVASKELSKILDGTVETFANFLNGLWSKTSNSDSSVRYLYFDYPNKEVILIDGTQSQEVYEWEVSKVRHNGIYLTTVNSSIMTLHREFDITLTNIDEIKLTIRDYINLLIKENNAWDGQYKKLSLQSSFSTDSEQKKENEFITDLKNAQRWITNDELVSIAFKDYTYSFSNMDLSEEGIYSFMKIGDYNVLQFRSNSDTSFLQQNYALSYGTKTITETVKRKKIEKIVQDKDTLIFTPVRITPTDCFATEGASFTFTRQ